MLRRRPAFAPFVVLSCLVCMASSGCNSSPEEELAPVEVPSEAEAQRYADNLLKFLESGQGRSADFLDADRFFSHSSTGIDVPAKHRKEFKTGFLKGLQQNNFFRQIRAALQKGGYYELVRVHEEGGQRKALFRLVLADGALNYHDYHLVKTADGKVIADDLYIVIMGERLSESMRRMQLMLARELKGGIFDKLMNKDKKIVESMPRFQQMAQAARGGSVAQGMAHYRSLPTEVQSMKFVQILRVQLAGDLGNQDEYVAVMNDFRSRFPNDPSVAIVSIDYFLLKRDFENCLKSVDELDRQVGGDPYLDAIRCGVHAVAGRFDESRRARDRAVRAAPKSPAVRAIQVGFVAAEQDHARTLELIQSIDKTVPLKWEYVMKDDEVFGAFKQSPQYRQWQAYLQAKR